MPHVPGMSVPLLGKMNHSWGCDVVYNCLSKCHRLPFLAPSWHGGHSRAEMSFLDSSRIRRATLRWTGGGRRCSGRSRKKPSAMGYNTASRCVDGLSGVKEHGRWQAESGPGRNEEHGYNTHLWCCCLIIYHAIMFWACCFLYGIHNRQWQAWLETS